MTPEIALPEDRIVLAAEYVLGTLDADERDEARRLIEAEPEFAALVSDWERRLAELHAMVDPVEPPEAVWERIRAALPGIDRAGISLPPVAPAPVQPPASPVADPSARLAAEAANDNIAALVRSLGRWRGFGVAMSGAAAVFAMIVAGGIIAPDSLPARLRPRPQVVEVTREVVREVVRPAGRYVAVLQKDPNEAAFVLTVDTEARSFSVRRIAAAPEQGKSYELWLISRQFPAPRSLGTVDDNFSRPATLANYDPATIDSATCAITLEPQGGSPTGVATGPVLWTGTLVDVDPRR